MRRPSTVVVDRGQPRAIIRGASLRRTRNLPPRERAKFGAAIMSGDARYVPAIKDLAAVLRVSELQIRRAANGDAH